MLRLADRHWDCAFIRKRQAYAMVVSRYRGTPMTALRMSGSCSTSSRAADALDIARFTKYRRSGDMLYCSSGRRPRRQMEKSCSRAKW